VSEDLWVWAAEPGDGGLLTVMRVIEVDRG
jgi:hypothetical protein